MNIDQGISSNVVDSLVRRAQPMLEGCIGQAKTMRLDKKTTQSGIIVSAEIDRIVNTGRAAEVVFKIVMECGSAKTRREFFCRHLPV